MTVQVKPQQQSSMIGKALPLAGAAIGGYLSGGSPQGAMAGAQAGNMVGGFLGANNSSPNVQASAMSRRMGGMTTPPPPQANDTQALDEARLALAQQPPEMQQKYGPALQAASLQARRKQGVV